MQPVGWNYTITWQSLLRAPTICNNTLQGQVQKLQAELAASQAEVADMQQAMQMLQRGNDQLARSCLAQDAQTGVPALTPQLSWQVWSTCQKCELLAAVCCRKNKIAQHCGLQGHVVVDRALLRRVLPLWRSGKACTCSLTPQQADDISQLSSLAPQQIAILWQVYYLLLAGKLHP